MNYTFRGLLGLTAFTALGFASILSGKRAMTSILLMATVTVMLFALLIAILSTSKTRTFWIGFAVFSIGFFYLMGGTAHRGFYSLPAIAAESAAVRGAIKPPLAKIVLRREYDAISQPTPYESIEYYVARRIDYSANCMNAVYMGIVGGFLAMRIANRESGNDE